MTSRYWVRFFFRTLFLGGASSVLVGFIARWSEFQPYFTNLDILSILSTAFWLFGVGLIFSVLSQMGYFAYLTIHRFGLGIFKTIGLWNGVQWLFIAVVLFDLVYFRFQAFAEENESVIPYVFISGFLLIIGLVVATLKARQTNKDTFVSALFFMVVITTIEWFPVLRANEEGWLFFMLIPLVTCNAYQLLRLPKYLVLSQLEREKRQQRKAAESTTMNQKRKPKTT
ncbi:KinB-signaling pathway activation protein [Bacillus fonticola]|uniref:KinB-signaling pathway activation protein n=1 Tax=Bacillus fonticola TaxID=2728853 RepID=UPI0014735D54|nr:KinB-signaling pathway activation protein [Bacillus fonticola]